MTDFKITERAANRIDTLIKAEETDNAVFRIAVLGGGCSGFQYSFSIDGVITDDDKIITASASSGQKVKIAIDSMSIDFLGGGQLDFVHELIGQYFQISNPNATASCGCGTSFAV